MYIASNYRGDAKMYWIEVAIFSRALYQMYQKMLSAVYLPVHQTSPVPCLLFEPV